MPKIILKKSSVTSKVPTANDLVHGELAINYADGKLFYKNASNSVQEFSANVANALTIGTGLSGTSYNGSLPVTIALASNYGDTTNPYASKTAGYVLAAPTGTNGQPTFRALAASDIPTLNQNTTGTASNVTGTVAIANGGTGQTTKTNAFDALSPLTTKGDLVVHDGTNNIRVPIGTNGYVLTADSTQASGLKWAAGGGGGGGITDVSQDTSPELGGNLALSGYNIVSGATTILNGGNGSVNLNGTVKGHIIPDSNETYDLGSATYKFRDLYLSGTTINLGGSTISADGDAIALPAGSTIGGINVGTLTLKGAVAAVADLPANNNTLGDAYVVTNFNPDKLYFWDENQWVDLGSFQGPQGDVGPQGPRGGISYTFSSTTSNSDPGSGIIRYNNSTIASVTSIYIDNLDSTSTNQTSWYSTWDDSTSSVKGFLILQSYTTSGTVNNIFKITGNVTDQTGYYSIPVEHVSGSIPTNNDVLVVQFIRTGDVGQTGSGATVTVREVNSGGVVETITGVTTLSFDADGGFDVVDQGSGQVKVTMNSTFKYWEVAGQTTIVASGLDTIKFVPSNGISITTNTTANPKEIGFSLSASLDNLSDVTITSPTNGQVLKYNGTSWVNGTDSGGIALTDISVTDSGGDGSLSYNNTTGVITYTGPSASDVRAHFSAGTGISITSGEIANTGVTSISGTANQITASGSTGSITLSLPNSLTIPGSLAVTTGTASFQNYYEFINPEGPAEPQFRINSTDNNRSIRWYSSTGTTPEAEITAIFDGYQNYGSGAEYPITVRVTQGSIALHPDAANSEDRFIFRKNPTNAESFAQFPRLRITGTTANDSSTSTTTGALTVAGGVGIAGSTYIGGDLTVTGNLTINGTTTTINSTTISVDDKNIELGSTASPTDTTADGGGITLKGATDKTFNWSNTTSAWTSSEHVALAAGKTLLLNGATSGTITIQAAATAGTNTLTLPSTTGTVITTGDTGTVTDGMLAGSISDSKLSTISTAGKISNSATTATSASTASTIVLRDSSGNFSAGTITASLSGNASTVTNGVYTTDTGTVTNTMLAGSIANNKLTNSSITINGTSVSLGSTRTINLSELGTVSISSPTNGQVLGYNGTSWVNTTSAGGTPGGSNTQVQYNSSGSFAGSSNLTFDGTSLTVSGTDVLSTVMIIAVSDETTSLTTGNAKVTFRAPFAMTLTQIPRASVATASTSGLVVIDINESGTSVLGANKLSIDANEKTSTTAATATTLADSTIADDAEITIDIDNAGTGAKGLKIHLYYKR